MTPLNRTMIADIALLVAVFGSALAVVTLPWSVDPGVVAGPIQGGACAGLLRSLTCGRGEA